MILMFICEGSEAQLQIVRILQNNCKRMQLLTTNITSRYELAL